MEIGVLCFQFYYHVVSIPHDNGVSSIKCKQGSQLLPCFIRLYKQLFDTY